MDAAPDLVATWAVDDTRYVWPITLRLPPRPPKLVYLDLLHWVSLAKANSGHRDGERFASTLAACLTAVEAGAAVFPVSDAIYMEVSKIGLHRQRHDLRAVIERVSQFRVVTSRVVIATHEVEALLDRIVGPSADPVNRMDYLDWGVARAFGMVGGFRFRSTDTGEDITAEARDAYPAGPEAFDRILASAQLGLNRDVLEGPKTTVEQAEMRATGWNPRAGYEVAVRRAQQEIEQVGRFNDDPAWRKGRIRDVVAAREVAIELISILTRGLVDRGMKLGDLFTEPNSAQEAFDSLPSFDVSVSLKTAYHRDPSHRWTPNDILDIDALASTVPYCDVVATDKQAARHLRDSGLVQRLGTVVLADLNELPTQL